MVETPPGGDGKRRRLQQLFEHANKVMAKDDFDYATNSLTQCVLGDPGNLMYVQTFLANLKKKYNNNKKGGHLAFMRTAGTRGLVKKASLQKHWDEVIKHGLEILKLNPWDASTLVSMAQAAGELGLDEVELAYLKGALEADPKDAEVNRLCARALGDRKLFDQAIHCWRQVSLAKPNDEEAKRAVGDLAVEKTIVQGGYEDKEAAQKAMAARSEQTPDRLPDETDEQRLLRLIRKNPSDLARYVELATLYTREEEHDKAEQILLQADKAFPGNADIRERLDDLQLNGLRRRADEVKKKLDKKRTPELEKEHKKLLEEIAQREIQYYKCRCERFPSNLAYRYELGLRYQRRAQYKEAIIELQRAKIDPRRKGVCNLALGRCFQQVNQPRLALDHFAAATTEIGDHDLEQKKMALYMAGTMAMSLQQNEVATRYLTSLAGLDYAYRDVSALLDKLAQLRDDSDQAS